MSICSVADARRANSAAGRLAPVLGNLALVLDFGLVLASTPGLVLVFVEVAATRRLFAPPDSTTVLIRSEEQVVSAASPFPSTYSCSPSATPTAPTLRALLLALVEPVPSAPIREAAVS